jgi:hypothetical protein
MAEPRAIFICTTVGTKDVQTAGKSLGTDLGLADVGQAGGQGMCAIIGRTPRFGAPAIRRVT